MGTIGNESLGELMLFRRDQVNSPMGKIMCARNLKDIPAIKNMVAEMWFDGLSLQEIMDIIGIKIEFPSDSSFENLPKEIRQGKFSVEIV